MPTLRLSADTSSSLSSAPAAEPRRWTFQRIVALAAATFALIGTIVWMQRPGDFAGYVTVGELVLAGKHIYRDAPPGLNTWPPFFSLLCVPLALLARPTPLLARAVWLLLNFALLWMTLRLLARLIYDRDLVFWNGAGLHLGSP